MSRSYRIKVRESLRRVIRAEDHVSSQLELLEILPSEQMGALLGQELERRGFAQDGGKMKREQKGVSISVDLESGEVTVSAEVQRKVDLKAEREGRAYADGGVSRQRAEEELRKKLAESLEHDARQQATALQKQVTDKLEGELADVRKELDQAVNRATAAALKLKASQMGQIKELTEDRESGALTIVVEV